MVKYKCWTCRTDIESPESKVGQREICSHCGTPSAVPKALELELNTGNELCYYCEQRKANPHFAELVPVGRWIEHPYFFCLDCSSEWQELEDTTQNAPKKDYSDTESSNEWVPRCTSCFSTNFSPTRLPPIPTGKYYTNFKYLQTSEFLKSPGVYLPGVLLRGDVRIPCCAKCKILHTMISKLSWGVGGTTAFVTYSMVFIKLDIGINLPGIFFAILLVVPMVITSHLVAWVTRLLLCFTIGQGTDMSKDPRNFHIVQDLRKEGW